MKRSLIIFVGILLLLSFFPVLGELSSSEITNYWPDSEMIYDAVPYYFIGLVSNIEYGSYNFTFYIDGIMVNSTIGNSPGAPGGEVTFNSITEGRNHTYSVRVTNGSSTNASGNTTFHVDRSYPLVSYLDISGVNSNANNSYWNQNFISVRINYTELTINRATFALMNGTNSSFPLTRTNYTNVTGLSNTSLINSTVLGFNFTDLADGMYRYNVSIFDSSSRVNSTNITTIIIHTVKPLIDYVGIATYNNTNISVNSFMFNLSITEPLFANVTYYLINGSSRATLNYTRYAFITQNWENFTNLTDGTYIIYANVTDLANNTNVSQWRTFGVDMTYPLVSYGSETFTNGSNFSVTTAYANVSLTEANFANWTFILGNMSSGLALNTTRYNTSSQVAVNFTGLADGWYYINVTATDTVNHRNTSTARGFLVDTVTPLISYASETIVNNTNLTAAGAFVNVSLTEINFANFTFSLFNGVSGAILNVTNVNRSSSSYINFTGLSDGSYIFNVTVTDTVNHKNATINRFFTLETTSVPLIDYTGMATNNSNVTTNSLLINVTHTEASPSNVTFYLKYTNGVTYDHFFDSTGIRNNYTFTNIAEGTYVYNVSATNAANIANTSQERTVIIDLAPTAVNAVTNNTVTNNKNVTLICNEADGIGRLRNVSIYHNLNGSWALNMTNITTGFSNSTAYYFNNTADGIYIWTCMASDALGVYRNATNNTITVDTGVPVPTITLGATSITIAETISISCSIADTYDSYVSPALSIKLGSNTYSSISAGTYAGATTAGTYTVRCQGSDDAGNAGEATRTFTVTASSDSGSSSSGGGGSSTSAPKTTIPVKVDNEIIYQAPEVEVVSLDSTLEWGSEGVIFVENALDYSSYSFEYPINGKVEEHSVTIESFDVASQSVTLLIQSDPVQVTLDVINSPLAEIDLNADGLNDVYVTLISVTEDGVSFKIQKTEGWYAAPEVIEEESNVKIYLLILIIILTLTAVGFIIFKKSS